MRAGARRPEHQVETTFGRNDTVATGEAALSRRTNRPDDNSFTLDAQVAAVTFTSAALRATLDGSFLQSDLDPIFLRPRQVSCESRATSR